MSEEQTNVEVPDEENGEPQVFDREYVEKLRRENAEWRVRVKALEDSMTEREAQIGALNRRVFKAMVVADGRLHNPEDLEYDEACLDDEAGVAPAIDTLLSGRPYLAKPQFEGDIGQDDKPSKTFSLAGMLQSRA